MKQHGVPSGLLTEFGFLDEEEVLHEKRNVHRDVQKFHNRQVDQQIVGKAPKAFEANKKKNHRPLAN